MMEPGRIAILMLMLLLIAIFGITTVNNSGSGPAPEEGGDIEYLTKVKASSIGSVYETDGSAKLILIGNEKWIYFDDVGPASVKLTSGKTIHYTVTPAKLKLILLTGQSNSVFFTAPRYWTDPNPIAPGKCFYFGTEADPSATVGGNATPQNITDCTIRDMVSSLNKVELSQIYPVLCSDLLKESSDRFLIINSGIGGKSIANWNEGNECDGWLKNLTIFVDKACEGKIDLTPEAVLWIQGEADRTNSGSYYYDKFTALCEKFHNGYYTYKYPAVYFSVPTSSVASYENMTNPAKAQIAASEAYSWIVNASTVSYRFSPDDFRDGVHYTQRAYSWIGEAFARAISIYNNWNTVEQTIVILESFEGQPETVTGYGTTGNAYTCTVAWNDTIGTVTPPSGMAIASDIAEVVQTIPEPEPEPEET